MVFDVSVASNGDWFLSTSAFNTAKTFEDVSKSRVTKFCQLATNGGVKTHVGNIRWITFMPDAEGYIGVTVVDGVESCFYEGIPQSLEMHLSSSKSKTLRSVSVGHDNSWIVVYGDGSSNWNGIPDALAKKLKAGYSSTVESVILSPKASEEFIINYESGASYYLLPPAWRPAIATQEGLLQELTARLQQTVSMNAANSAAIMRNAAVNANRIAATSALAYGAALQAGFACQSSGNF